MDRLISEQAVIDSIEFYQMNPQHFDFVNLIDDIKEMPSAEPKTGHWIWCFGSHKCSNCEKYTCFSHKELLKYCPNCGAKMSES